MGPFTPDGIDCGVSFAARRTQRFDPVESDPRPWREGARGLRRGCQTQPSDTATRPGTPSPHGPRRGTWKRARPDLRRAGWLRPSARPPACCASVRGLLRAHRLPQPSPGFSVFFSLYFWVFSPFFFPSTASYMDRKANNHSRGFSDVAHMK